MTFKLLSLASSGALVDLDGTFFIQLILFFIMFTFLYAVLFKPVVRMIEARQQATVGELKNAQLKLNEADDLMSDINSQIMDIRLSAVAEKDRAVEQAKRKERDLLAKIRTDSREILETARIDMNKTGEAVKLDLEKEIKTMADIISMKILDRKPNTRGLS